MPATTAAATMSPSRYTNFLIMQPRHAAPPVAICNHLRSTGLTKDTDSVTERGSKVRVVGERSFAHCDSVPETFLLFVIVQNTRELQDHRALPVRPTFR